MDSSKNKSNIPAGLRVCSWKSGGLPTIYYKVLLPALSPSMKIGTIVSWEKKEGDKLNEGDLLAEIETGKATIGFETPMEGYLAKILVPTGSKDVPLGKLLCIVVLTEEDVAAFQDYKVDRKAVSKGASAAPPSHTEQPMPGPSLPPAQPFDPPSVQNVRVLKGRISSARKVSAKRKLDFSDVKAAGPGKQTKTLEEIGPLEDSEPPPQYVDIPVSHIQQVSARDLLKSQEIPRCYLSAEINVDVMLKIIENFNPSEEHKAITLNDFLVKASAEACKEVPAVNSSWQDTFIRQYRSVDVRMKFSTDFGFVTLVISEADKKGLVQICGEMELLIGNARKGELIPQGCPHVTFTISNLGNYPVRSFSGSINPPQSSILTVGAIEDKVVPGDKGIYPTQIMNVTLSCDQRVIDDVTGARWLSHLKKHLENPSLIFG